VVNTETPETPVVENPELGAMARYKSGQTTSEAMPQSTNTTPETQTTTSPIDVKKLEEEVVANSANTFGTTTPKSGVEYLDSLYNELKPMTAEEEERRKRGAMSASAIAHLGNMMGALGNVINVNKGAVSQTSPTVKNPDITSFEEKVRKQREAHADRLYKIDALRRQQDKEDWTRKQAEAEFELKKQTAKYNNALNALRMQVEQGKLTAQEYDNEVKRINAKFASLLKQAELNRTNAQTRSYDSSAYASTERGRYYSRGGSGSKNQPYEFSLGGKTYTVNKNRWNDANKSELLRLAGSDGYVEYEDGTEWNVKTGQDEPVIKRRRMTDDEALRYAINHINDATRRYLDWLGGESESEEIKDEDEEYAISEDGDAGTSKKDYAHYKR
jgi:hypothetical protein